MEDDQTPNIPNNGVNSCEKYFSPVNLVNQEPDIQASQEIESYSDLTDIEYDGLENLAGYICYYKKPPDGTLASSETREYTWVSHHSEGGYQNLHQCLWLKWKN